STVVHCLTASPSSFSTLSLHDALPICFVDGRDQRHRCKQPNHDSSNARRPAQSFIEHGENNSVGKSADHARDYDKRDHALREREDRKSTRLNSSHLGNSYAVFCLKKKE